MFLMCAFMIIQWKKIFIIESGVLEAVNSIHQDYGSAFNLPHNYYPTADVLISNLNRLTLEHVNKVLALQMAPKRSEDIFTLDGRTSICSFSAVSNLNIKV